MANLSRRNFLKLLTAAVATPLLPAEVIEPNIIAETDFGFTFGPVVTAPAYSTFDEIIRTTLREQASKVAQNIQQGNAILLRLQNNDHIKITRISTEEQTKRIINKVDSRRKKFDTELRTDPANTVQKVKSKPIDRNIFFELCGKIEV